MAYTLDNVVPWGRSFKEYQKFFSLSAQDLRRKILSCADGPAGFNAEMTQKGYSCVSFDPIYQFTKDEIEGRVKETADMIIKEVRENQDLFLWDYYKSPDEMLSERLSAMRTFLDDYEKGLKDGRYINDEMPFLKFADNSFDLILCSHFLFTYSEQLGYLFHLDSLEELIRIGNEIRVFPVMNFDSTVSEHLDKIIEYFNNGKTTAYLEKADYEFQVGGNQMLVVKMKET